MGLKSKNTIIGLAVIIIVIIALLAFFIIGWDSIFKSKDEELSGGIDVTTNPFLWRIEGENPSYLFGSIHLSDTRLLTLPDVVIEAIDEVDVVYTEVKFDEETVLKTDQLSRLPSGQTINDLLPQDVEERVDSYLKNKGLDLSVYSPYKIWVVTSNLALLDELEFLLTNPSLDQYIWNLAVSKDKNTGGIETVEMQIDIFDSFSTEEQIEMLNDALDELEDYASQGKTSIGVMKDAYLEGDLESLHSLAFSYDETDNDLYGKFIDLIFTDRNYNMTQFITDLITNNPGTQYFFTIGAGHYYGEDGLLNLLENEGFTITRVQFDESDSCDPGEERINNRCYEPYVTD